MIINTANNNFCSDISGYFEYFIDENNSSDKPIYTAERLYISGFGVVVARRIDGEKRD